MKKIISLIFALVLCAAMCTPAFANSAIYPNCIEMHAVVSNPDGAIVYDGYAQTDDVLPYNTKVTVSDEWTDHNNNLFALITINGEIKDILIEDLTFTDNASDYQLTDSKKLDKPCKILVVAEKGIELYPAPSLHFEKLGTVIPFNEEITITHIINDGRGFTDALGETGYTWGYTTYNGVSGWAYIFNGNIELRTAYPFEKEAERSDIIITSNDGVRLTEAPCFDDSWYENGDDAGGYFTDRIKQSKKISDPIPKWTALRILYTYEFYFGDSYECACVEYNGVRGWLPIKSSNVPYLNAFLLNNNMIFVSRENGADIYDSPFEGGTVIGNVPCGKIVPSDYVGCPEGGSNKDAAVWRRVASDGVVGWISLDNDTDNCIIYNHVELECDCVWFYTLPSFDSEQAGTFKIGDVIAFLSRHYEHDPETECMSSDWVLCYGNGKLGWVYYDSLESHYFEKEEECDYKLPGITDADRLILDSTPITDDPEPTAESDTDPKAEESSSVTDAADASIPASSPKKTVIYCAAGAAAVVAAAVIIIVVINKKKK